MPLGTYASDDPLPARGHPTCPDVEAALRGAARGPQPGPRAWADGLSDGPLRLPEGCALRWLAPSQACEALPGLLVLLGDSLSRNLAWALQQSLSGNYASGPLTGFQPPLDSPSQGLFFPRDWHNLCTCDELYRICAHVHPPPSPKHFSAVCPAWWAVPPGAPAPIQLLQWFGGFFNASHLDGLLASPWPAAGGAPWSAAAPPRARRAVLVAEIGPGWGHGFVAGSPEVGAFLDAVFDAAARAARGGGARVVCYLIPAPVDAQKPGEWAGVQGLEATLKMHQFVADKCAQRGGRVLDGLALTRDTYTRDGTHYATRAMTVVAQALLNLLLQPWPDEAEGA